MRMISSVGASIGRDEGSAISKRYADEFAFSGKIHRLDIQLLTENRAEASVNAEASTTRDNGSSVDSNSQAKGSTVVGGGERA